MEYQQERNQKYKFKKVIALGIVLKIIISLLDILGSIDYIVNATKYDQIIQYILYALIGLNPFVQSIFWSKVFVQIERIEKQNTMQTLQFQNTLYQAQMSFTSVLNYSIMKYISSSCSELFSVIKWFPKGFLYAMLIQLRLLNVKLSNNYSKNLTITPYYFNIFTQRLNQQSNEIQLETGHYKTKYNDQDVIVDDRLWMQLDQEASFNNTQKKISQSNLTFNEQQLLDILQPQTFIDIFSSEQMVRFIKISECIQFVFQTIPFIVVEIINNQFTDQWFSMGNTIVPILVIFIVSGLQIVLSFNYFLDLMLTETTATYLKMQNILQQNQYQINKCQFNNDPLISLPHFPTEFVFVDAKDAYLFNNIDYKLKEKIKHLKYLISNQCDQFKYYMALLGQYGCCNIKRIELDLRNNQLTDSHIEFMIDKGLSKLTKFEQLIDISIDLQQFIMNF